MSKDMRGTIFQINREFENDPTHLGKIQIDGVTVNVEVYPEQIGKSGSPYRPLKLKYPKDSNKVLVGKKV